MILDSRVLEISISLKYLESIVRLFCQWMRVWPRWAGPEWNIFTDLRNYTYQFYLSCNFTCHGRVCKEFSFSFSHILLLYILPFSFNHIICSYILPFMCSTFWHHFIFFMLKVSCSVITECCLSQHFWTFPWNCPLEFSEIVPAESY